MRCYQRQHHTISCVEGAQWLKSSDLQQCTIYHMHRYISFYLSLPMLLVFGGEMDSKKSLEIHSSKWHGTLSPLTDFAFTNWITLYNIAMFPTPKLNMVIVCTSEEPGLNLWFKLIY